MLEQLQNVNPLFFIFGWLTVTTVVSSIAYCWHSVRKVELEASLKQEMIQRGMAADEIKQVIEASAGNRAKGIHSEPSREEEMADCKA